MLDAAPQVLTALNLTVATYVRLRPGVPPDALAARLRTFALAHYPSGDGAEPLFASLFLNSMATVHLHPFNPDTNEPKTRVQTLCMPLRATGLLILLLAGINFVNLVTARATRRAVEVGIRKGLGALRNQLMVQFMGESLGYSLLGMAVGVGLAALFLPSLNAFLDRQIALDLLRHPLLAIGPVATAIVLGVAAGVYPAVILSRFPPAQVLKARAGALIGGGKMRLGLVVFQFTVTIALLIATIVIYRADHVRHFKGAALRKGPDTYHRPNRYAAASNPGWSGSARDSARGGPAHPSLPQCPASRPSPPRSWCPLLTQSFTLEFGRPDWADRPSVAFNILPVDFGYFSLYQVPLLAGRDFSREFSEDKMSAENKSQLSSAIINETAMRALGFTDASAAIGQEIRSTDTGFPERRHRVIGVVPGFSSRFSPQSWCRQASSSSIRRCSTFLNVKLSGSNLAETLRSLDAVWLEFVPERPINRVFLDDRIAGLYLDVTREGRMFAAFAGFAVAIGCLGLIGLSAYTAERRTKEIGIRKALGASTVDVSWLVDQAIHQSRFWRPMRWPGRSPGGSCAIGSTVSHIGSTSDQNRFWWLG